MWADIDMSHFCEYQILLMYKLLLFIKLHLSLIKDNQEMSSDAFVLFLSKLMPFLL